VPANEIIGLLPGEVFVHRNIANVVVHTDLNCLSVIQFAVDVLKIKHIMVVGHYGCGGVRAVLRCERVGLADNWLRHVQDVREKHDACLCRLGDDTARSSRLCEFNVIEQVAQCLPDDDGARCVGTRAVTHRARLDLRTARRLAPRSELHGLESRGGEGELRQRGGGTAGLEPFT